jgi:hypothetical protein
VYPSLPYTVFDHSAWCPGVSLLFFSLLAIGVGLCRGACVGLRALGGSHFRTTGVRLRYDMMES